MTTPNQPAATPAAVPAAAASQQTTPARQAGKTPLRRKIWDFLNHQVVGGLTVYAIIAIIGAVAGLIATTASGSLSSPGSSPARPAPTNRGFTAQVAWTDDGGGGSASTTLYAFTAPDSHVHDGEYPLGESLTVVCQTPHGRPVRVGPGYQGPDAPSTTWYQLDNGAWVPAVYVHVDQPHTLPICRLSWGHIMPHEPDDHSWADSAIVVGAMPRRRRRWPPWLPPSLAALGVGAIALAAALISSHQQHAAMRDHVVAASPSPAPSFLGSNPQPMPARSSDTARPQPPGPSQAAKAPSPPPAQAPRTRRPAMVTPSSGQPGDPDTGESSSTAHATGSAPRSATSAPGPLLRETYAEEGYNKYGVPTFSDYQDASSPGATIQFGQVVQISCKIYDPSIPSVNPGGYWYRIASAPWNNFYYAAANTFLNGDPRGGPYTHNYDASVPDC